jgi:arabinan endo-1,5-alpha-L-arabinosidase
MRRIALCLLFAVGVLPGRGADWALTGNLGAHDPSILQSGGTWWVFTTGTGLPIKTSPDGLAWTQAAPRFSAELPWWRSYVPGMAALDVWAPDVHPFGGRIWCYYCVSQFGTNQSAIGLTSCSSLAAGDWRDDGLVLSSAPGAVAYNALDPSLATDGTGGAWTDANGNPWLVFGSWFDGLHVTQLDPTTMKPTGPITSIAARANGIEGANIVHANGYFYLFASIDRCCEGVSSTYKIAYGRATAITGPYYDQSGNPMTAGNATVLLASGTRWIGPGGQSVYWDGSGWIVAYHAYDAANNGAPTLRISDLYWDANGWPTLTAPPPPSFVTQPISVTAASGETVVFLAATSGAATLQWYKDGAALAGATGSELVLSGVGPAAAGSYTCVASGAGGQTSSQAATLAVTTGAAGGQLVNISCRAQTVSGSPLTAGFVIGGSAARTVLVRAAGPALAPFGVPSPLPDPLLQLWSVGSASGNQMLAAQAGWNGDPAITAAAEKVGAFSWGPGPSGDSALLVTLPPGLYTAQVTGAAGDTGTTLIEVYEVP